MNKDIRKRESPLEMQPEEFRKLGHELVDRIADLFGSMAERKVTPGEPPAVIQRALDASRTLPEKGTDATTLMNRAADLLFDHSLLSGHPRFWGYITSSPAPIGALAEMLAAAVNPNVSAWVLSPMASEIEAQTVRWIAGMLNYPTDCGGLLVSGGNMANFVCFMAARRAKAEGDVRTKGMDGTRLRAYCSRETHTWIQKAADLSGMGTDAIRWIDTDSQQRIDVGALRKAIQNDLAAGDRPFMVAGTAGTVSTGAIDPLHKLAEVCREFDLWFHVDGAYGAMAAILPDTAEALAGMSMADSVATDPHKWLYAPLEAGCALVRDAGKLRNAFSYNPPYYHFGTEAINYFDLGPQNSRGFRALKVWLALQQAGREGYVQMLTENVRLSQEMFARIPQYPELEPLTQSLSITTFRYAPANLRSGDKKAEQYLNDLNRELLTRLQNSGEAYLSNAVVEGKFALRACIVNFRTSLEDVEALLPLVVKIGKEVDEELRQQDLRAKS
ncbi:MAG TPA: aminotransferase class V-fold PLP-dependent enzyme [Edaphobacter sp.]|nr:aminotransferase class V-fold PLP-dependent enzyme [Edaphobacter sp.]